MILYDRLQRVKTTSGRNLFRERGTYSTSTLNKSITIIASFISVWRFLISIPWVTCDCTVCDCNKKRFPLLWVTNGGQTAFFILSFDSLSCGWFQWDGLNANESAALPKIIFSSPPQVSYRPDKSQQTQSMDRCVLHLTLNELIITGFSRCAVIMLCIPNVAITHCWLKLIEDYVFPRQCVHVLFQNECCSTYTEVRVCLSTWVWKFVPYCSRTENKQGRYWPNRQNTQTHPQRI